MRRVWAAWVVVLLVAVPAYGAEAGSTLTFSFKTRQGPTMVEAHPPSGEVGDTFESSLSLVNRKTRAARPRTARRRGFDAVQLHDSPPVRRIHA